MLASHMRPPPLRKLHAFAVCLQLQQFLSTHNFSQTQKIVSELLTKIQFIFKTSTACPHTDVSEMVVEVFFHLTCTSPSSTQVELSISVRLYSNEVTSLQRILFKWSIEFAKYHTNLGMHAQLAVLLSSDMAYSVVRLLRYLPHPSRQRFRDTGELINSNVVQFCLCAGCKHVLNDYRQYRFIYLTH